MNDAAGATRELGRVVTRTALVLLAAALIAGAAFLRLGPPAAARAYRQNEVARFAPTIGHGLGQLAGETFLLVAVAYAGRRWLRVRL